MYTYPDYLMHHGILGMKWGIRRYVNKDGSLTSAGLKRQSQRDSYISDRQHEINHLNKYNKQAKSNISDLDKNGTKSKLLTKAYGNDYSQESDSKKRKSMVQDLKSYYNRDIAENNYYIKNKKKYIQSVKNTDISKTSMVEGKERSRVISKGIKIATTAAGIGLSVAMRKSDWISTGKMVKGMVGSAAVGLILGTNHYNDEDYYNKHVNK